MSDERDRRERGTRLITPHHFGRSSSRYPPSAEAFGRRQDGGVKGRQTRRRVDEEKSEVSRVSRSFVPRLSHFPSRPVPLVSLVRRPTAGASPVPHVPRRDGERKETRWTMKAAVVSSLVTLPPLPSSVSRSLCLLSSPYGLRLFPSLSDRLQPAPP